MELNTNKMKVTIVKYKQITNKIIVMTYEYVGSVLKEDRKM